MEEIRMLFAKNVSSSKNIFFMGCAVINKPDAIQETVTWESDTRWQETNKKGHIKKKMEEDNHQHPITK